MTEHKNTYFVGDREFEYVITEENGVFKGKTEGDSSLNVTAETLNEVTEILKEKLANLK